MADLRIVKNSYPTVIFVKLEILVNLINRLIVLWERGLPSLVLSLQLIRSDFCLIYCDV